MANKVGRPKKKNAVKSGQLKKDEVRFTFITDKAIVENIKAIAKAKEITVKQLMKDILLKELKQGQYTKNELLLRKFLDKKN